MISLSKGQTVSLAKLANDESLLSIELGLGWDAANTKPKGGGLMSRLFGSNSSGEIDLDASCLVFNNAGDVIDQVWFSQLESKDGSITHSGDNRTGDGDGDDETISVRLSHLPVDAQSLVLTINSFTGQNFNEVANAYCRVIDSDTGNELTRYTLSEQGSHTGIIVAVLKRNNNGQWDFKAIGDPVNGRTIMDMIPSAKRALV